MADDGGLLANASIVGDKGGDVANRDVAKGEGVGDVIVRGRKEGGAGRPVKRGADLSLASGTGALNGEYLTEDSLVALEARVELRVAIFGGGENDVKNLQGGTAGCDLVGKLTQALSWPGPWAEPLQAGFVDVDNDDATFGFFAGCEAPYPVAGALLKVGQRRLQCDHGDRPNAEGNEHRE